MDRSDLIEEKKRAWFGKLCVLEDGSVYDYQTGITMYKINKIKDYHTIQLLDYEHVLCKGNYYDNTVRALYKKDEMIDYELGKGLDVYFDKDGKISHIKIGNIFDERKPISVEDIEREHYIEKNTAIIMESLRELKKLGLSEKDAEELLARSQKILAVKDKQSINEEEKNM